MKTLIITLFLFLGLTCNNSNQPQFQVSDCGTIIESPYLAEDLIFETNEVLTVALRFIQYKKIEQESTMSIEYLTKSIEDLNAIYFPAGIKFSLISFEVEIYDETLQMSEYRTHILNYKRLHANTLPAIDVFIYPVDFNYYPGVALAIKSDGIAIQKKFVGTNTLAHELGHCLGLHHTHQGEGNGYYAGDFICDTPGTDNISGLIDANCSYDHKPNNLSDEDMEIIIHNYMSYVNRDCRKEFTKDQIDKMRYNLAKEPMLRNTLIF